MICTASNKIIFQIAAALFVFSCSESSSNLDERGFKTLMNNIAKGWSTQNTELALSSFDEDAIYTEPPNIQFYRGHDQLRPYFDALEARHKMEFHNLWFDEKSQTGAGEYTFSGGNDIADSGVVIVELKDGKIKFWREYQRKGPADFEEFIGIENKNWEWHIGNYP